MEPKVTVKALEPKITVKAIALAISFSDEVERGSFLMPRFLFLFLFYDFFLSGGAERTSGREEFVMHFRTVRFVLNNSFCDHVNKEKPEYDCVYM